MSVTSSADSHPDALPSSHLVSLMPVLPVYGSSNHLVTSVLPVVVDIVWLATLLPATKAGHVVVYLNSNNCSGGAPAESECTDDWNDEKERCSHVVGFLSFARSVLLIWAVLMCGFRKRNAMRTAIYYITSAQKSKGLK